MEKQPKRFLLIYFITFLTVFILDEITKIEIKSILKPNESVDVLPILKIVLIYNTGIAFGMLSSLGGMLRVLLLEVLPVIAIFVSGFYAFKSKDTKISILMGMLSGGAFGNLFERVYYGKVTDFLYFHIGDHYWPAFNVADSAVSLSIAGLILLSLKEREG
ncbi:MAG: signal peptidase II [Hydrogenobaculum sp.]|jgi:signal peptidase II|uniref:signal peptidase II n=1 Tax=unclassified Hydrogenobaculum TaxID=2622382 RepID=UPI0001C51338|nr:MULTISPECIES: signal peptidase II [unclassified Hydrogenobaculum]AEF19626.1 lipoprotein signal peptidase [Hydrogenobaculum sp. 3684]AEG46914.1 Lipoprotein signal peptidase [Hydrogenobaculum sp. SHO]AGG15561.1 signal peptidase II [Hydrogenobaculum sp. HO]AGH93860.1 signal peptidase II [Hydrogenobaculum sp. SN]